MSSIILPFSVQLPAGYSLLTAGTGTQGATTTGTSATAGTTPTTATNAAPADVVNIGNTWATGDFTAKSGDHYRMSELFKGSTSDGQTIAGYRVALGAGSGKLFLGSEDVTDRTSFTADDFRQLTYVAGAGGSQSLTVVAQAGKLLSDGNMTQEIDSQAVQITATIAGTRSINAMNALSTRLSEDDPDAGTVGLAQQAAIFTGWSGAARPTLQTDGNFDTKSGDSYRMSALFAGSAPTGQTIAGYRVALGDPGDSGGGLLLLAGKPTDKTEFTADEFRQLTYVAGTSGSQGLTVVAPGCPRTILTQTR